MWTLSSSSSYINGFQNPRMSNQGAAGKRKHRTLMTPQKLEIIWRLESGQSCSVMTTVYVGLSIILI
jgi:hypothetical protein